MTNPSAPLDPVPAPHENGQPQPMPGEVPANAGEDASPQVNPSLEEYLALHHQLTKYQQRPLLRLASWVDRHIPENGWLNRLMNGLIASLSILKHQGFKPLFDKLTYKVKHVWAPGRTWTKTSSEPFTTNDYYELTDELCSAILTQAAAHPTLKPDIINFPFIDWEFRIQRPQHLAVELARLGHRIFYIQARFSPGNKLLVKKLQDNVFLVILPKTDRKILFNSSLTEENVATLQPSIILLTKAFNIQTAILKVDLPFWRQLAAGLKDEFGWKLVYDCMDEHTGFSHNSAVASFDEHILIDKSDLVLFSSHVLQEKSTRPGRKYLLLPNGADYELFHQAAQNIDTGLNLKYRHPVIGYYGAIANWFDTHLVRELAVRHPEWTFILVGSTDLADLRPLHGLQNLHLLGEKPYQSLPDYLRIFDVCIIPFIRSSLTDATNPVKLYEFLAAGKPVVATRLEEISRYQQHLRLADTLEQWELSIIESLQESKSEALLAARYEFGQKNTWKIRAEVLETALAKLYPKISVIVITYNKLEYTRLCLASIVNNTEFPNYEIIIVDNASTDGSQDYLTAFSQEHPHATIIQNRDNRGFAAANNQGARAASGEYLVFLNNDTVVTPGWLQRLLFHLQTSPHAGMVGPVTNNIGNEARVEVDYTDLKDLNLFAALRANKYSGVSFELQVLALYCAMISRSLYLQLDGLDERYHVGMFEDDDLALKICQAGYTLLCAEDAFVHHFHGVSFTQLTDQELQRIFHENRLKFEQKWGTVWQPHQNRPKS